MWDLGSVGGKVGHEALLETIRSFLEIGLLIDEVVLYVEGIAGEECMLILLPVPGCKRMAPGSTYRGCCFLTRPALGSPLPRGSLKAGPCCVAAHCVSAAPSVGPVSPRRPWDSQLVLASVCDLQTRCNAMH